MKAPAQPNPRPPDDDSPIRGGTWITARIEDLIAKVTPSCTRVTRLISDSLERPLSLRTRLSLRLHYLICCYCRRYEAQLHRLRRFAIAMPPPPDDAEKARLSDQEKERIKKRLREGEAAQD